jgi:hypothetical protein
LGRAAAASYEGKPELRRADAAILERSLELRRVAAANVGRWASFSADVATNSWRKPSSRGKFLRAHDDRRAFADRCGELLTKAELSRGAAAAFE